MVSKCGLYNQLRAREGAQCWQLSTLIKDGGLGNTGGPVPQLQRCCYAGGNWYFFSPKDLEQVCRQSRPPLGIAEDGCNPF